MQWIEDLKVGDLVVAYEPKGQKIYKAKVTFISKTQVTVDCRNSSYGFKLHKETGVQVGAASTNYVWIYYRILPATDQIKTVWQQLDDVKLLREEHLKDVRLKKELLLAEYKEKLSQVDREFEILYHENNVARDNLERSVNLLAKDLNSQYLIEPANKRKIADG